MKCALFLFSLPFYYLVLYFFVISYSYSVALFSPYCTFALVVIVVNPVMDYASTYARHLWYAG